MFTATLEGQAFSQPTGKILCIGRNYAAHAAELNNPVPDEPVLFLKPADAACDLTQPLTIPKGLGSVHHELEVAVLIGSSLKNASEGEVQAAIAGFGLGLDLTLRDVQSGLKDKGLPWERAKAFDGACPLSPFVAADKVGDLTAIRFTLTRNGKVQQQGCSADMLNPIIPLIAHMSRWFTINPGDVIMTGTPTGVGPLEAGDQLVLELEGSLKIDAEVQR
ncbi:MAG: fumarylacetoacetate hydrolase family protein [Thalassolituus sp.]